MSRTRSSSEAGFTLAGLIVILTIISVMIAYTVPRQWSIATARERDQQTLFAMKQYARAILAFQDKNKTPPVSLDQLKQARNPRLLRGKGEFVDPLTREVDWIPIPATAAQPQQGAVPNIPGVTPPVNRGVQPPQVNPVQPGQAGGYVGPFIGVRPNKTGTSYLVVNGSDTYEQWSYTINDLNNEILQRRNAMAMK